VSATVEPFRRNDPRLAFDEDTHQYTLGDRRLLSVTQILGYAGLADFSGPWFSDAVKARGTALHAAIGLDVEEVLDEDSLDDDIRGGVEGWRRFLLETGAEIEHWERRLCDPGLGVAGRLDGIVRLTDPRTGRVRRLLIDVKRGLYDCAAIQLAAYVDMAAAFYDGPVYFERAALVLPCDGTYRLHPFPDTNDRVTWQAAVRVVTWRLQHDCL
jgi:hypothetical protein